MAFSNFITTMHKTKKYVTLSHAETIALARRFAKYLKPGDVVFLVGELGSGKTVFTKGICKALGVKEEVTSPSFVIASEYEGKIKVCHIDLYRLNASDITALCLEEYFNTEGITVIEWADRIPQLSKRKNAGVYIFFEVKGKNQREICIEDLRH
ncbi:MAG: tRNA (adenosine(37)-N6)-threonylcarbamoyltransferase complex ATPase subunit type 1 TsaE [bacterium]